MFLLLEKVCFLYLTFNIINFSLANEDLKDDNIDRGSRSDRAGLWFGPRLGKRSLQYSNEDNRQAFLRLLEAADAMKYYYDQMQYYDPADDDRTVAKKVIFTPKLGRSLSEDKRYEVQSVDFTPRLGRRLADELPATSHPESYRPDPEQIDSRSKYFSPRLGRTMNFSPRLGRELSFALLAVLKFISSSHVVVAGNEEAFRSLAKKFVPQKLANQLASLMTQATEKYEADNYYENKGDGYDDQTADPANDQYDGNTETTVNEDAYVEEPVPKAVRTTKKHKTVQVNLDELVEKVRDRLLLDLQNGNGKVRAKLQRPLKRLTNDDDSHQSNTAKNQRPGRVPALNNRMGLKSKGRKPVGEVVENHDLFQKVKLSKGKGIKDSYEDYVTPKREYGGFESESREKKSNVKKEHSKEDNNLKTGHIFNQNKRFSKKRPPETTEDHTRTTRRQKTERTPHYEDYHENFKDNDRGTSKSGKIEYVDDDLNTKATATDIDPKAMTEFIGADYKEEEPPKKARTRETTFTGYVNTKRKQQRIVTNMPTRERYKIPTPNYYDKLPRIAEKYNFDEPIPEKDQEEENLKTVRPAPVVVNGKILK